MIWNDTVSIAETVKEYVEKNKKIPTKVKGLTYAEYGCLLTKAVISPGKELVKLNIKNAPNPNGDNVNITFSKKEYVNLAKIINKFISTNNRLPNYVIYNNKKINPKLCIYCFAKIVTFYNANKRLPNTCTFNSGVFKSSSVKSKNKHGHAIKSGCDNVGQNNGYYCGCHSIQEVFRNLTGKVVKQSTIARVAGTTTSGTDHKGLETAVAWFNKKYGYNLCVEWKNLSDIGWKGIKKIIDSNNQDCVIHNKYRMKWGHYEVINNLNDGIVKVQNSLGDKCSKGCYCGYVEKRSTNEFTSYIQLISQKSIMIITKK